MLSIFKATQQEHAKRTADAIEKLDLTTEAVRPPLPAYSLKKHIADVRAESYLNEYAQLAAVIGIQSPDLAIESFKACLHKLDIPIFNLDAVIRYMDEKSAKESPHLAGWQWRPLREKDHRSMIFGRACEHPDGHYSPPRLGKPASDHYSGSAHVFENQKFFFHGEGRFVDHTEKREYDKPGDQLVYDRTIPLHAVRRVAAIERTLPGSDIAFFVSDYALLPAVLCPDPFLMAVIPNINVRNGTGRFVIDFWDEPGFGIEQMLK